MRISYCGKWSWVNIVRDGRQLRDKIVSLQMDRMNYVLLTLPLSKARFVIYWIGMVLCCLFIECLYFATSVMNENHFGGINSCIISSTSCICSRFQLFFGLFSTCYVLFPFGMKEFFQLDYVWESFSFLFCNFHKSGYL